MQPLSLYPALVMTLCHQCPFGCYSSSWFISKLCPELRRPLRAADQHPEREDLHLHVVLVHLRGRRHLPLHDLPHHDHGFSLHQELVAAGLRTAARRQGRH